MVVRLINFLLFIVFSIVFVPLLILVFLLQPAWEKWSENAFNF